MTMSILVKWSEKSMHCERQVRGMFLIFIVDQFLCSI
jgi:hypothetical protein